MSAIHHLSLSVSDLGRALAFYGPLLTWLDFKEIGIWDSEAGFEKDGTMLFLVQATHTNQHVHGATGFHHLAFTVESRAKVDDFYNEVLLQYENVEIEDPPVDCPEYGEGYYATYFFDPDGLKLEVTYTPVHFMNNY